MTILNRRMELGKRSPLLERCHPWIGSPESLRRAKEPKRPLYPRKELLSVFSAIHRFHVFLVLFVPDEILFSDELIKI